MITVHKREAVLVKKKYIPIEVQKKLFDKYSFRFYEEKACAECEFRPERHCDVCDQCAAFKGGADLSTQIKIGETEYIKGPIGDKKGFLDVLARAGIQYKIKSHHPTTKMKRRIKFTGTLKEHQPPAVEAIITKKQGVLRAPPRSGKTVMAAAAICEIAGKTMIMASQREWLLGFQETFIGSETQEALTDCKKTQIGFAKTYEDFLKYDICLVTTQTFWSPKGKKLLRRVRDLFASLVVDECHTGAAPKYAQVIAALNCLYKIGLSGTPNRKDGRYVLMRNLMGPIIADIKVARLRPRIRLVKTQFVAKYKGQVPWTRMVSSLEKDPKRLKLIAQWAVKDAANGHMVLIPMAQMIPIKALVAAINAIAGKTIAYPFTGQLKKADRDRYLQMARQYKAKVLVGTTKLLTTGTNIPRASALYDVTMSSNLENCEQRTSRVLTPWDDKPEPIVRIFLDDTNVRRNCLRNEWFQCVKPKFKPLISERDQQLLNQYLSNKGGTSMGRIEL